MLLRAKNEGRYKRESGILLHISSLPSKYGIGSLGEEAYRFIDFLNKSHQRYWQILPLCPIGEGNSPYKSTSAFAGEILYIDLDMLVEDGLIEESDLPQVDYHGDVSYRQARNAKLPVLRKAVENFDIKNKDFIKFCKEHDDWLSDYAVFAAIKKRYPKLEIKDLKDGLKYRNPTYLEYFKKENSHEILFIKITQFLFYKQYFLLRDYAHKNHVKIIGDIPFYVSYDSADVWKNPNVFKLGRDLTPVLVAGVPPDIFSTEGQLWGNPIYDWEFQKATKFNWWKKRIAHNALLYDVIRIDHFRAFADYYCIPYGSANAITGTWEKGIGTVFFESLKETLSQIDIIAEDLGGDTPEVAELILAVGYPGMKVLQFAFNSDLQNSFLPKNYTRNCICYTGTHDNDTTIGWYEKASAHEKSLFSKLVPHNFESPAYRLISLGMRSRARMVIIPLQDYLCLDSSARMNTPGTAKGNWKWRFEQGQLDDNLAHAIKKISGDRNRKR